MKHLIHIGYPKTGSTFLQDWFAQHPEILYQPGALGGYYDLYGICRETTESNVARYRYRVTSGEALSAPHEATGAMRLSNDINKSIAPSMKAAQRNVCQILGELFPGSKILIVTRGFTSSLRSHYAQIIKTGGILHPQTMFAALDESAKSQLRDYFDYDHLIGLYRAQFGAENVIVLPFELLCADQTAFLDLLQKELELTPTNLSVRRRNASLSPAELYWYPVISRVVAGASSHLGARGFHKIYTAHVDKTRKNKWRRVIGALHRLYPDKVVRPTDFPAELIESCRGKAESLRANPLYAAYAEEYLWSSKDAFSA